MKKFLFLSFLVSSLASSLFATDGADLLASLTNGKISDNSPGVKVLSLEEAKQVKGGYLERFVALSQNEIAVIIGPESLEELYPNLTSVTTLNANTLPQSNFGKAYRSAIAGITTVNDFFSSETATNSLSAPFRQLPGYSVTRNIGFNKSGAYTYFTYKVITYDTNLKTYHNITSSQLLNNNAIIKELAQKYKSTFESILGGLRLGLK